MIETLKKSLLTGVGLALRSKNEIEDLAKEVAEKSQMNQEEAKAFLNDCRSRYDEARAGFDKKVESAVEKLLLKLDLPTKSDIVALNQRIDDLTRKLEESK